MICSKLAAKTALCGIYKYSGAGLLHELLCRAAGRQFMAILLFHRVTDDIPEDGLTVSTAPLSTHLPHVAPRFSCRVARRGVPPAALGQPFPRRTVAITFDDCYRDNLYAARTLADHGLPATFFMPTGFIGTDHVFAWDRGLPRMANLTWDDLREMSRLGFEIGSHTVTHANFGRIECTQAVAELVDSKATLEKRLERPVRWFAFPFGGLENLRPDLLPLVEEAGYQACLSGHGGFIYPGSDSLVLPREPVPYFHNLHNLELHLSGSLNWYYALKRRAGLIDDTPRKDAEQPRIDSGCQRVAADSRESISQALGMDGSKS